MSQQPAQKRSEAIRVSPYPVVESVPRWRRGLGWLMLLAALSLLLLALGLVLTAPPPAQSAAVPDAAGSAPTVSLPPASDAAEEVAAAASGGMPLPTVSAAQLSALLLTPPLPTPADNADAGWRIDPFTIIPDRARMQMTSYTAQRGDTIDGIAYRYGLKRESIAWCNPPIIAQILRPGDEVTIPPADGACHQVLRTQGKTIRDIAEEYGVDDPFAIIDAPANGLTDVSPETLLPSNYQLFIPGGEGKVITWNAPVQQDGAGNVVAFDPGSPYSCGARSGGGTAWVNPLPNGTFVRGYYAGHSGIDIAAATGTPIYAANGGPILYSGWNNWGYGRTVVIGHGPWSTLYGHMSSIAVRCGQSVYAGQVIGYVGSTGNSSGPHLHFEIRYRNEPQNPSSTAGIGW